MFVTGAYTLAQHLQPESGLLAATVMGITLANQRLADVKHILEFKENLRVLLISSLFILLAARVDLGQLGAFGWRGPAFVVILLVLVRPLSVMASTIGSSLSRGEIAFLAMMAPRGIVAAAVASVFALRLGAQGEPQAAALVPLTFLAIIGTVLICSLTARRAAHHLGVADPDPQGIVFLGAHPWTRAMAEALAEQGFRVLVVDTNRANVTAARMAGLKTYGESILAEHALDELDLGGIGKFIAALPNDWINVLAVRRFREVFGRGEVYQVPPVARDDDPDLHRHLYGRWLFGPRATFAHLADRVAKGAVVKATPITEQFTYEDFRRHYGDDAICLFVISESKRLRVLTDDRAAEPQAGETLVSLVEEKEVTK